MTRAAHADAVRTLQAWSPHDAGQDELRTAFLAHLRDHPDATSRSGPPAHLTVGALVLDPTGEHVLLTHHRKARAWFQFGGHIEAGDASLRAAAARELQEESGVAGLVPSPEPCHLHRHALPAAFGTCREHLDVRYLAVAPRTTRPVVSQESLDVRWFAVEDLPGAAAEDLRGLIAAGRRALGRP